MQSLADKILMDNGFNNSLKLLSAFSLQHATTHTIKSDTIFSSINKKEKWESKEHILQFLAFIKFGN